VQLHQQQQYVAMQQEEPVGEQRRHAIWQEEWAAWGVGRAQAACCCTPGSKQQLDSRYLDLGSAGFLRAVMQAGSYDCLSTAAAAAAAYAAVMAAAAAAAADSSNSRSTVSQGNSRGHHSTQQ
jgi:hypothetical protein